MFIEAKKLIGMSVAAIDMQSRIGEVDQVLIDPDNGQILGLLLKTGGIFSAKKVLSAIDIADWDPNGVVTETMENVVEPEEIVRIKKLLDEKIFLIGMKARTESQKRLGTVEDLLLDTDTLTVAKYYLKDLLGNSRIFPSSQVVKIENNEIIFSDDLAEVPPGAEGVTA